MTRALVSSFCSKVHSRWRLCVGLAAAWLSLANSAHAQIVVAEPAEPISVAHPQGALPLEAQVVFVLVVNKQGEVESAIATATLPPALPSSYIEAARAAVLRSRFIPSTRDGKPIRSRIEYVAVFPKPSAEPAEASPKAPESSQESAQLPPEIEVRGAWLSPRGLGDVTLRRRDLEASPRQFTTELLSAAPGFFVDHENSEGIGNDVYLRGFDLDHGSGIEMAVAGVPVNQPIHVQGQGYADVNFIIPELVNSVHVLQGNYDPRQGDAAIVGSAFFELAVPERGYRLSTSYGSFAQKRVLGIAAPKQASDETFFAFAARDTDGFGARRASRSGVVNAQFSTELGPLDRVRFFGVGYVGRARLPGVVREDHVNSGQIGFYDSYPFWSENQTAQSHRALLSAEWRHGMPAGDQFMLSSWVMRTGFLTRQNFSGAFETSQLDPTVSGLGDLFERTNEETAFGLRAALKSAPFALGEAAKLVIEPGTTLRTGISDQSRSLLVPSTLARWDRRDDVKARTLDVGGYVDVDLRLFEKFRISGGPRVDVLAVSVDDRLANLGSRRDAGTLRGARRSALGVAFGPRVTAEYAPSELFAVAVSYGEGFRSLNAASLEDGADKPYSKVRSVEVGMRSRDRSRGYRTSIAAFNTWVDNELVFVAESGGFETQSRSVRRGIVTSLLAEPTSWLLASAALSVTEAVFQTNVPNVSHHVPSVPPVLFRADVTVRGNVAKLDDSWVTGRAGAGYTFMSRRHLTDYARSPMTNILNLGAALRYSSLELALDAYNLLDLEYADSADYYVSNLGFSETQQFASFATHMTAAPPRSLIATLSLYF